MACWLTATGSGPCPAGRPVDPGRITADGPRTQPAAGRAPTLPPMGSFGPHSHLPHQNFSGTTRQLLLSQGVGGRKRQESMASACPVGRRENLQLEHSCSEREIGMESGRIPSGSTLAQMAWMRQIRALRDPNAAQASEPTRPRPGGGEGDVGGRTLSSRIPHRTCAGHGAGGPGGLGHGQHVERHGPALPLAAER